MFGFGFGLVSPRDLDVNKVVTVSARSRFPKGLDVELPLAPLGSLKINQSVGGSGGNGGSGFGSSANNSVSIKSNANKISDDDSNNNRTKAQAAEPGHVRIVTEKNAQSGGSPSGESGGTTDDKGYATSGAEARRGEGKSPAVGCRDGGGAAAVNGDTNKKNKKSKKAKVAGSGKGGGEVTEMDYTGMLNKVLPPEVRVLAWAPVTEGFSARFSCSDRTYRQENHSP